MVCYTPNIVKKQIISKYIYLFLFKYIFYIIIIPNVIHITDIKYVNIYSLYYIYIYTHIHTHTHTHTHKRIWTGLFSV